MAGARNAWGRGRAIVVALGLASAGLGCGDSAGTEPERRVDAAAGDAAAVPAVDAAVSDAALALACKDLECESPARCALDAHDEPGCVCPPGYEDTTGDATHCGDVDECDADAHDCDTDPAASCMNTEGGYDCECPVGFQGDGHGASGCADRDECAEPALNDCLSEERCTNLAQGYACDCDLVGTFASMVALQVETDAVIFGGMTIVEGSQATLRTFELRKVVAQDDGGLTVEVTPCGGTSAELCSPFYDQAWSQDFPRSLWSGLATASGSIALASTRVGDPFITDDAAVFLGVSLPAAYSAPPWPWPTAHADPDLTWLDPDGDGLPGATSIVRHPFRNTLVDARFGAGDFDTVPTDSPVCGYPYDYWLHTDGSTRVREFHTGSRSVSRFVGEISSCDLIEGELRGPGANDTPIADALIGGCVRSDGVACTPTQVDGYDNVANPNHVTAGCFQQVRVPDSFTCADVLSYGFTLLVGPNADQCPPP
jgi:hypothetical protein